VSAIGVFAQHDSRGQNLAAHEGSKAGGRCKQAIDQPHVSVELRLVSAVLKLRQADREAAPAVECAPMGSQLLSRYADGSFGHHGRDCEDALERRVPADEIVERTMAQLAAEPVPEGTDVDGVSDVEEAIPSVKEQQRGQGVEQLRLPRTRLVDAGR
jgi:hypothetical protein